MAYTREQLYTALRNADKAGDEQAARQLTAAIKAMDAPKAKPKKKETSHLQGVVEGLSVPLLNAATVLEKGADAIGIKEPLVKLGSAVTRGIDDVFGVDHRPQARTVREARRNSSRKFATSPTQSSETGKVVGNIVGTLPTLALPGGAFVQGAASGALLTNARDVKGVATDAVIGGVAGKVADKAFQVAGKALKPVASRAGAKVIDVADRLGIRPTPATTGGSFTGGVQRMLGVVPGAGGVVSNATSREADELARAAGETAARMGNVSTPQAAGETLAKGAKAFRKATSSKGGKLYAARDELMGGKDAPILMGSAAQQIRDFANEFPGLPILDDINLHPGVAKLTRSLPDGPEPQLSLDEATNALSYIRKSVRALQKKGGVLTDDMTRRVKMIENAFEGDIVRAAEAADAIAGRTGANTAVNAQKAADQFWRTRAQTLQGPLQKAAKAVDDPVAVSGESVFRQMVGDMDRQGGNLVRLRKAWAAMPTNQKRTFSATAFDQLGRAKPGASSAVPETLAPGGDAAADWSFSTFHTNFQKMSPEARKLVFGGRGVDQQIDDIARYAARLKEVSKTRNSSNTWNNLAEGSLTLAYMAAVGNQAWQGDMEGAAKMGALLPAGMLLTKGFVSSPAGRLWVRNVMATLAKKGGTSTGETTLRKLTRQLPVIAENNPGLREEAGRLLNAINDNVGVPLAAGDRPEDQQEQ